MKTLRVTLKDYPSKFYPVNAIFTFNNVRYNLVFETTGQAKNYFRNRFYPMTISFMEA